MTADVRIETTVMAPSGYAYVARKLILGAKELGLKISLKETVVDKMVLRLPSEQVAIFKKMWDTPYDKSVPLLRYGTPVVWGTPPDHPRNLLKFVWENDKLPPLWKEVISVYDEFVTINDFVKDMIDEAIHPIPKDIHIVPHGVDTKVYYPDTPLLKKEEERFVFLSLGQWIKRKSFEETINAYFSEFTDDEKVTLVLKTYGQDNSFMTMKAIQNTIKRMSFDMKLKNPPPVLILSQMFNEDALRMLYSSADCFVLPSRGESWCLPYMQSMACGVPAIAQEYGGQLTYMNNKNSFLIKPQSMNISNGLGWYSPTNGLKWAVPSVENIRKAMRYAYEHPSECKKLGEQARKDVQKYTWEASAKKLVEVLTK